MTSGEKIDFCHASLGHQARIAEALCDVGDGQTPAFGDLQQVSDFPTILYKEGLLYLAILFSQNLYHLLGHPKLGIQKRRLSDCAVRRVAGRVFRATRAN